MTRLAWLLPAFLPALVLAACAESHGPPPVTSLAERECASAPDLSGARPLLLDPDKKQTVDLDAATACWQTSEDTRSAYLVFQLPDSATPYLVDVTSAPRGNTLFSPRLILLDDEGKVARELRRDAFMFHGASLYTGIRSHAGEHYLVVASDPGSVGQQVSQISGNTHASMIMAGTVMFNSYAGSEARNVFTYAHNGAVTVSARPLPKIN
jgi:hypothetical protein